ncbi:serine/threonine-protein kinase prpf4B [Herrania umbratica]|uniref:Serine/threonine-protein kinase PRP4 homolog n=1 Tax=Herrania umbratica TaxID=108875 RepID=A0A6J1BN24_9ROSI|nr:serine/threonine-protein kinase prpf4B [Herrania umbratica]XP_021299661.1 serine/threonine-protein kinase prpf4B [Herrania umbratica]XP_021299662.1 serine/threonine-protein kinase prpf4B [Herrania umbratica]XP_021299663.1 serine/threonine-protein kinase prpf4B [Herrania umbratica]XP_021299664.1 serine/threonine-protein kinase prpf4B [Herrania umbratica]XP_021299665.1 serine/threonine-protein kinase prpf4B [Herrania umbratica]XP_021299666.1 serine/threonine-protein kinase prpf4B [Herrania u
MASDTPDSHRRKHRRSPSDDEETDKSSKRHKHRHHKHRHHRHRSKKHEDEGKDGVEDPLPLPPSVPRPDDDVEEGEILDEEPAAEIRVVEYREGLGVPNPGVGENSNFVDEQVRQSGDSSGEKNQNQVGLSRNLSVESQGELASRVVPDSHINGDFPSKYNVEDGRRHGQSRSPSRSGKKKSYHEDVEEANDRKPSDMTKSLSSESSGEKYKKSASSPFDLRDHEYTRSRSESDDLARERSRSQSIVDEEALLKRSCHHERDPSRDGRHGSRNPLRGDDRERSVSYGRYVGEKRHQSMETRGSERSREREIDRERRREKERERSREREMDIEWRRDRDKDRDIDGERRREKERARSRDRDMSGERRREKERERSRDRELDGERRREKERGKSRDRDLESGRIREKVLDRSWDRESDRDRNRKKERDWSRDRSKANDRERDRNKEKNEEWNQERERERRSDRSRDKGRDMEIENDGYSDRDRYKNYKHPKRDETETYRDRIRKNETEKVYGSNSDPLAGDADKIKRDKEEQDDFEERIALKLAEQEEDELSRIKEESRKRRQAILEKYKNQHLQQQTLSHLEDVNKDNEPVENCGQTADGGNAGPDVLGGGHEDLIVADPSLSVRKSPPENGHAAAERTSGAAGLGEGTPKSERSDDIFCDDIFGETPTGVRKSGKGDGLPVIRSGLHDNWDDAEGYYSYRFGELLDSRYEVTAAHGKGVFSTVVRAKDLKAGTSDPEEVAIKIIRNNETMHKAGQLEVQILKKLAGADPDNKRHCVCFLSSFKYRNHLCLVFESLHMNLREVLKKFGRNIGLKLTAVRAYAKQLFIALKHLKNCGVLHCDIKPDNMLVNEAKNVLKLCDFGNAMFAGKNEITPYLVSRFYRAPEIILGLPYDHPMDIWSVGCCLYELYTGKVLFPGPTNNDMLRLHMELKGPFPKKMLRKGAFTEQHFDQDLNFHATEEDPVTKKTIKRMILNMKPKDMNSIIVGFPGEDPKMVANFKDLLEKIFVLDPEKRMTVTQALAHPFITGK